MSNTYPQPASLVDAIVTQESSMRELPTPTLDLSPMPDFRRSLHPSSPTPAAVVVPGGVEKLSPGIEVGWARHLDEVREAQRLRHEVFAGEMGAILSNSVPGHDVDLFDDYCEHLLVREAETRKVIGTYRVLTPEQAKRAGSTYSDTEFDLVRLRLLRGQMVELGRSCVHRDHRQGSVIMALWGALAAFMQRNSLDTMIGCASIPMNHEGEHGVVGGGHAAASIWRQVKDRHMAPIDCHVRPRLPLPIEQLDSTLDVEPPALIKGYLRLGAKVMGPPAWDPDFNAADLPMIMRIADMPPRYRRHFLGA